MHYKNYSMEKRKNNNEHLKNSQKRYWSKKQVSDFQPTKENWENIWENDNYTTQSKR